MGDGSGGCGCYAESCAISALRSRCALCRQLLFSSGLGRRKYLLEIRRAHAGSEGETGLGPSLAPRGLILAAVSVAICLMVEMKWRYFVAAVISVSIILIANGVPLLPILAGCSAIAFWNVRKRRNSQSIRSSLR